MDLKQTLVGVSVIIFLLVGAGGVANSYLMIGGGAMEEMAGCPFAGHDAAVCTTNPLNHVGAWQNQFAATLTQNTLLTLLLLFAFALFAVFRSAARPLLPYPLPTRRAVEGNLAPTHALLRSLALLEHSPTSA